MEQSADRTRLRIVLQTVALVVTVYLAWIGAHLTKGLLDDRVAWLKTSGGGFAYWTVMKVLLWIAPSLWLVRVSGQKLRDAFGLSHLRRAVLWGSSVGLALALITTAAKAVQHQPLFDRSLDWGFINAVVIAPLFEEFMFRGAVLGALMQRYRFAVANVITALLFLGLHLPGWYFQGRLWEHLTALIGGALAIFLLGLLFGLATHRGKSLIAGILAHAISNLFSL
ncbi:MAG: CPBP family intramembrane metalloprotease [Phycisphaerae bacterium]|nr:CPBP family intramembrane metalloprotease [Phycisphaerae bacterium]